MTSKEKKYVATAALFLLTMVIVVYCGTRPAKAEDVKGQFFIPLSIRYIEDFGGGAGLGYRFQSGLQLSGQVTYDHFNAMSLPASCRISCSTCNTTVSVPNSGQTGFTFTVGIPISGGKKK